MPFLTRGHPAALRMVARSVAAERAPHALLIAGPASVGKTTLGLDLAAGLLCLAAASGDRPCWSCPACRKVLHGNHPDLHRLAPEGAGEQIRIAAVQRLVASLALLPLEGRVRVALIEAAHKLNPDAQNALLKTLEEPPPQTTIILATDEEAVLLPTVRSRCARLRLTPVASRAIGELLGERGVADRVRAAALARLAGGRPGLALALAHEPEVAIVQARLARSLLDILAADRRLRLGVAADLLTDGALIDAAIERARTAIAVSDGDLLGSRDAADGGAPDDGTAATGAGEGAPTASDAGAGVSAPGRRGGRATSTKRADASDADSGAASRPNSRSPLERRRAVLRVLAVWRDVARDLALVTRGGDGHVRQPDLIEELRGVARTLDEGALVAFLGRLDGLSLAIEAYANPDFVLDALLLAWPSAAQRPEAA